MPAVMEYNLKHDVMQFAKAAVRVWGCEMNFENPEETAREGIKRFREFLKKIGMPGNFAELGAKEEDIEKMAEIACHGDVRQGTIGGFVPLKKEDVIAIYKSMV